MGKELKLITAHEAAIRLGVHPKTMSYIIRKGRLDGFKIANRWLIDQTTFDEFSKTYVAKKGRPKGWSPKKEVQR